MVRGPEPADARRSALRRRLPRYAAYRATPKATRYADAYPQTPEATGRPGRRRSAGRRS